MNIKSFDLHNVRVKPLIISIAVPFASGIISYLLSGSIKAVYHDLDKPFFAPPTWIFPVVWNILFLLMGISCYLIWRSDSPLKRTALTAYGVQLFLNAFWTFIFFRLGLFLFALIWLGIILIAVMVMQMYFYNIRPLAAYLNIPYALWLIFAGLLNGAVYFMN